MRRIGHRDWTVCRSRRSRHCSPSRARAAASDGRHRRNHRGRRQLHRARGLAPHRTHRAAAARAAGGRRPSRRRRRAGGRRRSGAVGRLGGVAPRRPPAPQGRAAPGALQRLGGAPSLSLRDLAQREDGGLRAGLARRQPMDGRDRRGEPGDLREAHRPVRARVRGAARGPRATRAMFAGDERDQQFRGGQSPHRGHPRRCEVCLSTAQ